MGCWWPKGLREDGERGQLPWEWRLLFAEVNAHPRRAQRCWSFLWLGKITGVFVSAAWGS